MTLNGKTDGPQTALSRRRFLATGAVSGLWLAGCTTVTDPVPERSEIWVLTQAIRSLSPTVDAQEAARAAEIAVRYPLELRERYGVTDPPLIHNTKVNLGRRPRGLCWHWAEDLESRLAEEGFRSLALHRAIANGSSLLLDHSTVVISATGAPMEDGLVLDGWRQGGVLYWTPVREDPRYRWERRADVFARRR
ncbi:hypothetical protein [Pseudooceanicola onchidii]|uniref:hypothetical protein n=1 Tax=Pseudooceanicola onchidii TaxID=2562279 RepID=UPI00197D3630|nr:hypothetical protein [Pseudooceanicola onchidii]